MYEDYKKLYIEELKIIDTEINSAESLLKFLQYCELSHRTFSNNSQYCEVYDLSSKIFGIEKPDTKLRETKMSERYKEAINLIIKLNQKNGQLNMTDKSNLIKQIDDFLVSLSPGCEGAIGVLKIERRILINKIKELQKENEELNNRIAELMSEPSDEEINKVIEHFKSD